MIAVMSIDNLYWSCVKLEGKNNNYWLIHHKTSVGHLH